MTTAPNPIEALARASASQTKIRYVRYHGAYARPCPAPAKANGSPQADFTSTRPAGATDARQLAILRHIELPRIRERLWHGESILLATTSQEQARAALRIVREALEGEEIDTALEGANVILHRPQYDAYDAIYLLPANPGPQAGAGAFALGGIVVKGEVCLVASADDPQAQALLATVPAERLGVEDSTLLSIFDDVREGVTTLEGEPVPTFHRRVGRTLRELDKSGSIPRLWFKKNVTLSQLADQDDAGLGRLARQWDVPSNACFDFAVFDRVSRRLCALIDVRAPGAASDAPQVRTKARFVREALGAAAVTLTQPEEPARADEGANPDASTFSYVTIPTDGSTFLETKELRLKAMSMSLAGSRYLPDGTKLPVSLAHVLLSAFRAQRSDDERRLYVSEDVLRAARDAGLSIWPKPKPKDEAKAAKAKRKAADAGGATARDAGKKGASPRGGKQDGTRQDSARRGHDGKQPHGSGRAVARKQKVKPGYKAKAKRKARRTQHGREGGRR